MKVTEQWAMNMNKLVKSDNEAKKAGRLVGRFVREQIADGYAYYKITSDYQKNRVIIEVVDGIGDDWQVPYWGKKATIDKKYAEENIARRDAVAELFGKPRRSNA